MSKALIIVDVQNDFLPGGALAVHDGDAVIDPLLQQAKDVDLIIASRDWHHPDHCYFETQDGPWPVHCVAGTIGAELDPRIEAIADIVIDKADKPDRDAYSAFRETDLADLLRSYNIKHVVVGGLTMEFCVKDTIEDALAEGFEVDFFLEGTRAINYYPGDAEEAIRGIVSAGATIRSYGYKKAQAEITQSELDVLQTNVILD